MHVAMYLTVKFQKRSGKKYDQFIECLGEMAVFSDNDDFLEYTRHWIDEVNRGGLFPLNDASFRFFVSHQLCKYTCTKNTCRMTL